MRFNSRRTWIALAVVVAAAGAFLAFRGRDKEVQYQTATIDRGDIVDVVGIVGIAAVAPGPTAPEPGCPTIPGTPDVATA